jgi:TolB-like protein/tetratricopeptide (TPR) repeat protein
VSSFFARLKERKLVQWTLAYLAGAWVVLQVMDVAADPLGWPDSVQVGVFVLVAAGFFVTLTLAWYHGEKGRQRVTAVEVLAVAAILVVAVAALLWVDLTPDRPDQALTVGAASAAGRALELGAASSHDPRPSVAVLPFESRSQLTEDTIFTDGVHGQILGQISKIRSLRVISRTSVLEYRDSPKSMRDIGAELDAEYVMEGGVQRAGDRVLVSANLIRASADESVWTAEFEYGLVVDSIFAVQRDVARGVADALSAQLVAGDVAQIESRPTQDLDAWNAYVEGNLVGPTGNFARWRTQVDAFERATRLDPEFGLAWAGLTRAYAIGFSNGYWTDVPAIRAVLDRAERIAPTAPETRVARATVRYYVDRDLPGARDAFAAALADRPNDAYAWLFKGAVERRMDLWEEAARSFEQANAIEPRGDLTKGLLSSAYLMLGRIEEAEQMAAQRAAVSGNVVNLIDIALSLRGDTAAARSLAERSGAPVVVTTVDLSLPYLRRDFDAALDEWLENVPRSDLRTAVRLGWIAELADRTDRTDMARTYADSLMVLARPKVDGGGRDVAGYGFVSSLWLLNLSRAHFHLGDTARAVELAEQARDEYGPPEDHQDRRRIEFIVARVYFMAGEHQKALDILEAHLEAGVVLRGLLPLDVIYDPIRDHPRFQRLLEEYPAG